MSRMERRRLSRPGRPRPAGTRRRARRGRPPLGRCPRPQPPEAIELLQINPAQALDLIGVSFIDGDGLALMQSLLARDVSLVNPSPFVAELLKGAGL